MSNFKIISVFKNLCSGTFIPYDPVTDRDAPARYGVLAGRNLDGSPIYVGQGDNSQFDEMKPCSARISNDPWEPGLFMTTSNGEFFSDKNAFFLANHSTITWIKVTAWTSFPHPNAIKWMAGKYPMMFGRKVYPDFTAVGRVNFI